MLLQILRKKKRLHFKITKHNCSSYNAVRAKCEQEMVAGHLEFLHSECEAMVREERRTDLANMYPLLHAVQNGLGVLVQHILSHITQKGLEAVQRLTGENVRAL